MKFIKYLLVPTLLATALFWTSCEDEEDLADPTITVNSPADGRAFESGDDIPITVTFSDDVALRKYTIAVSSSITDSPIDPYSAEITEDLTGELELVETTLSIPVDVASGNYSLTFDLKDDNGKDAEQVALDISIQNSSDKSAPAVTVTAPDVSSTLRLSAGDIFSVSGTVTDNLDLHKFVIEMTNKEDGDVLSTDTFEVDGASHSFEQNLPSPPNPGSYLVTMSAVDKVNNRSSAVLEIEVTE